MGMEGIFNKKNTIAALGAVAALSAAEGAHAQQAGGVKIDRVGGLMDTKGIAQEQEVMRVGGEQDALRMQVQQVIDGKATRIEVQKPQNPVPRAAHGTVRVGHENTQGNGENRIGKVGN